MKKIEFELDEGFKPCYKWITFNTKEIAYRNADSEVLNLVINGLPSIQKVEEWPKYTTLGACFKPCYKWITFNTLTEGIDAVFMVERSHFYMVAKIIHFSVF